MADDREPPPLFDDEEISEKDEDSEDLFATEGKTKAPPAEEEEKEDIFADAEDVPLDSPEDTNPFNNVDVEEEEPPKFGLAESTTTTSGAGPPELKVKPEPTAPAAELPTSVASTKPVVDLKSKEEEEEEEEESRDQYNIEITVCDPKKVGDGMGAYMAYKVVTKTTLPHFRRAEMSVYRRFSDFLGLHEKMVEKHQHEGRIIPAAPEKSVVGMTKIKMSKEDSGSAEFVEKRRAALERFVSRAAKHPVLRADSDFIDFLEKDGDMPRSTSTSALSGAGVLRLFTKVGDSLGKMTFKMDETDQWFEEKQQQVDALDQQLRKLHSSIEALVQHRKDLAINTGVFAKSAAMLGNAEEHTALSRALSQLAEIEEKIDQLHMDQADADFFVFSELIKDYISLVQAVKDVFHERVKIFKNWKDAEVNLTKKREARTKLELARKLDKIPAVSQEITEFEKKVEQGQQDFETISKNIRQEMKVFDHQRVKDFKNTIINYLETLMNSQQQLIKHWETFLPEAKAIA